MTQVQHKPYLSACIGMLSGGALLLLAGVLFATTPTLTEVDNLGRRLAAGDILKETTLGQQAAIGGKQVTIVANPGFEQGQKIVFEPGTLNEEVNRIYEPPKPSNVITLKLGLAKAHAVGSKVATMEETLAEMIQHQSSSGSLNALQSSSSSSIADGVNLLSGDFSSSQSMGLNGSSASSGSQSMDLDNSSSSGGNVFGEGAEVAGPTQGANVLVQFLISLCVACVYKSKVVDMMPKLPPQVSQADRGVDDFPRGVFDCLKDPHYCCFTACFPIIRTAHTNDVAGVCGFWETIVAMYCSLLLCGLGPCCLTVYFRIHLKENMGIPDHCLNDMCCAWLCFPCITGQQALSVDDAAGMHYQCCCSTVPYGGGQSYGGYGETTGLMNY